MKGDYEEFNALKEAKKQSQTEPINIACDKVFLPIVQKIATALRASQ